MPPTRVQAAADPIVAKAIAAGSAVASMFSLAQGFVVGLLGVPLGVPLAALAGVLYGITFRAPMNTGALWGNLIGCTLLGSAGAPLIGHFLGTPAGAMAGLAAGIGFLTQYGHAWLKSRRERLLDAAADRMFGPPQDRDGGQP